MSELTQILLTSSLTIIIFVAGQIVVKFLIEPFHDYKKLIGEIAGSLIFYRNITPGLRKHYLDKLNELQNLEYSGKKKDEERLIEMSEYEWKRMDEARKALRWQASQLMGAANAIPMYRFWAFLHIVPKREEVLKASSNLIGLSNSFQIGETERRDKEIAKSLRIKIIIGRLGYD